MGIKKFIETLKNFGDTISSAADGVFDEVNKTFDGLDTSKLPPSRKRKSKKSWRRRSTRPARRPTIRTKPYTFPRYTVSIPSAKAISRARSSDCFGVGPGEAILYRGK